MLRLLAISSLLLSSAFPALALSSRDATACPALPASTGGRKIGIVIDSSGSNVQTDPQNLRIVAAKSFNSILRTAAQGPNPDLVTVVDFDGSASVVYPLGDPAGAGPSFDTIDSSGSTDIYSGVKAAIDELTKNPSDTTAHRTGIIVLTDGEDSSIKQLITELNRAASLGIRVAFGFLSSSPPASAANLLTAILQTGGMYSTITSAAAQQNFVNLVLSHGPTDQDAGVGGSTNGTAFLLPGLTIAGNVSSTTGPKTYTYNARTGESLNFTVSSLSGATLDIALRDVAAATDLTTATTDAKGNAILTLDVSAAQELGLVISTANATTSLFTVGLNSSLAVGNFSCGIPVPSTNTTTLPPNGTVPATPTLTAIFTGGAAGGMAPPNWASTLFVFGAITWVLCGIAGPVLP